MTPLHYELSIKASPETVWQKITGLESYKKWTAIFKEGSFFEGDWSQGSEMRFLGPDDDGKIGGMLSRIIACVPKQTIKIEHYGMINDGIIETDIESIKLWAPAYETYQITKTPEGSDLRIEMEINESFHDYLNNTWPIALVQLRDLCED